MCAAVGRGGYGTREVVIRINGLDTPWGAADLEAAAAGPADAILVPKVSRPGDIVVAARYGEVGRRAERMRLWAMIETPLAILNAREIAAAASDPASLLACLVHRHQRSPEGIPRPGRSAAGSPSCRGSP